MICNLFSKEPAGRSATDSLSGERDGEEDHGDGESELGEIYEILSKDTNGPSGK